MEYKTVTNGSAFEIHIRGRFTFADYPVFRELMKSVELDAGKSLVFEMNEVTFVDSSALGMLLIAHEEAKKTGGLIVLRRPQGQVRRTLEVASMDSLFKIET
jgi:stage II sporulation protein AA (anti-sigma F factor antagonist)